MTCNLKGIIPALMSPCDDSDRFLEDRYLEHVTRLYQAGINGVYVCGLSGDAYRMSCDDRKRAAEIALSVSRQHDGAVIVHAGTSGSRDSIALAEHAAGIGADAVACIPPAGLSQPELVSYYTDIARASGLPLLVYYVPGFTKQYSTLNQILELLDIDGVVGLKFSDWDLFLMKRILIERPGTVVLSGNDEILLPALLYGAEGGVGTNYNFFPQLFVGIYEAVKAGDTDRAVEYQNLLLDFTNVVFQRHIWVSLEPFARRVGIGPHIRRRPWPSLDADTEKRILDELEPKYAAIRASFEMP